MLETRNIFIDTQAFVSNNFFQNKNLKRLAYWGGINFVNLYLTEITKSEIKSNIREDLLNAKQEINRFKDNISKRARILRNIPEFKAYIELPELNIELDFSKLSMELEMFIKEGNVQTVPYEYADLKTIVTKYFKGEKPFSPGKKKYEFPDAIVLSALDSWCLEKREKIYVISGDSDFKGYESERLIPVSDIKEMLDKINKQYNKDLDGWLSEIFEVSKGEIIEKLSHAFEEKVKDELSFEIDINRVKTINIEIYDFSIVDKENEGYYTLQFDYDIKCEIEVTYNNYSFSIYDKEDDRYYGYDRSRAKVELETTQTAEVELEVYYERDIAAEDADVSILSVYTTIPDEGDITNELEGYMDVF
ncbi:uncharacterized protein DUF4935 [Chitinophaga skermanii]|uniref:Uncharacterized protein DUF4935 n=1 Tax=Chitinophaga skermanii TaxID=331697 RepID=A0A327RAX3_9BACT|nr:PIN domain-containing protein [Chitinophaga skermanii]RAJ11077.1 uncharacterized protein DUF4935 [Chitinophaga skermanii]